MTRSARQDVCDRRASRPGSRSRPGGMPPIFFDPFTSKAIRASEGGAGAHSSVKYARRQRRRIRILAGTTGICGLSSEGKEARANHRQARVPYFSTTPQNALPQQEMADLGWCSGRIVRPGRLNPGLFNYSSLRTRIERQSEEFRSVWAGFPSGVRGDDESWGGQPGDEGERLARSAGHRSYYRI